MQFFTKVNGKEFNGCELISFNKVAIYSGFKPEFIKVIVGVNVYVMDYVLGELRVNGSIIHRVDKETLSILRPICFNRHTYDSNGVNELIFTGLGYQYTLQGRNVKCFIVLNSDDKTFEVVTE
ncbi:MAG: hypothetical protein WC307_05270 [Candidatus Nanoarchaeia archaeon]|jgi:hypothetical protein